MLTSIARPWLTPPLAVRPASLRECGRVSRRAWPGLAAAVVLACGLSACGNSAPAALSVRCVGRDLAVPDSAEVSSSDPELPPPLSAVPGIPRVAGTAADVTVPLAADPGDAGDGYSARGWQLSLISGAGTGRSVWSQNLARPAGVTAAGPDLNLLPHDGYVIVTGGSSGQYVAAAGADGRAGPACRVPSFTEIGLNAELLPHIGVVMLANPTEPGGSRRTYSLEGYSAATGKRLWSISTGTSVNKENVDFAVDGDTAYVWEGSTAKVAAYSAATGRRLWLTDPGGLNPLGSPNQLLGVIDGVVYALTDTPSVDSAQVVALRRTDGKVLWRRTVPLPAGSDGQVTVSQVGRSEVLVSDLGGLGKNDTETLVDAGTGATRATQTFAPDSLASSDSPQICDPGGQVAAAVAGNKQIHILSADPAVAKTIAISGGPTSVVITSAVAYVRPARRGAPVYGYDLATGKLAWKVPEPGSPAGADLYAFDGGFAVGTFTGPGQFRGTLYR